MRATQTIYVYVICKGTVIRADARYEARSEKRMRNGESGADAGVQERCTNVRERESKQKKGLDVSQWGSGESHRLRAINNDFFI